jgi:YihY family inner membrane protein
MFDALLRPIQRGIGFGQQYPPHRSILGFVKKVLNDWSLGFGAFLAYTILIALLPLLVTAFGIFGLVVDNYPDVEQTLVNAVTNVAPGDNTTKQAVHQVAELAANNLKSDAGGILAIGLVFSIWGGSRLFVAIDQVFTIIYRTIQRSFIIQNLISIGMLILFVFFMIVIFVIGGVPSFVINALPNKDGAQFGIFIAGIAITIFVEFIFFMLIYKLMPNKKTRTKDIWCGSLFAAILLDVFIILFPLYIRRFMGSFIGLIGFAVILITFFYYFSLIIILGAQINAYFFERVQPLPDGLGTFLCHAVEKLMKRPTTPVVQYNHNPYHNHRPRRPPRPYY